MYKRIKYICKNCSWETSIIEFWGDLKPKRCMNKKCNTSFLAKPEALIINRPQKIKKMEKTKDESNNKQKRSSKSFKQQEKEKISE